MSMYQIVVYIPESHLNLVKEVMFSSGAGRVGHYDYCAWQTLGQGQFRPLKDSSPYIGSLGQIETVPEYRVEMVCSDEFVHPVLKAMKDAHPYEEPAFSVWPLEFDIID